MGGKCEGQVADWDNKNGNENEERAAAEFVLPPSTSVVAYYKMFNLSLLPLLPGTHNPPLHEAAAGHATTSWL